MTQTTRHHHDLAPVLEKKPFDPWGTSLQILAEAEIA